MSQTCVDFAKDGAQLQFTEQNSYKENHSSCSTDKISNVCYQSSLITKEKILETEILFIENLNQEKVVARHINASTLK